MMPIDFPEANVTFGKPKNMTDEQCSSVRALTGVDADGFHFVLTVWQPNKEDLEAIKEGRPILLKICGQGMPPVSLYTYDEQGNANV